MRSARRQVTGLAALGSWVLGVLVLPLVHLAFHDAPHDHAGGGIHYHAAISPDASRHARLPPPELSKLSDAT